MATAATADDLRFLRSSKLLLDLSPELLRQIFRCRARRKYNNEIFPADEATKFNGDLFLNGDPSREYHVPISGPTGAPVAFRVDEKVVQCSGGRGEERKLCIVQTGSNDDLRSLHRLGNLKGRRMHWRWKGEQDTRGPFSCEYYERSKSGNYFRVSRQSTAEFGWDNKDAGKQIEVLWTEKGIAEGKRMHSGKEGEKHVLSSIRRGDTKGMDVTALSFALSGCKHELVGKAHQAIFNYRDRSFSFEGFQQRDKANQLSADDCVKALQVQKNTHVSHKTQVRMTEADFNQVPPPLTHFFLSCFPLLRLLDWHVSPFLLLV
jgi:hypothetical protein